MKFSEAWLREFVNPDIDTALLAQQLTMAGLEVGAIEAAAGELEGVVVAEVCEVAPHPDADKLKVCKVDGGSGDILDIVCGAPNVAAGMLVPLAVVGAVLPGDVAVRKTKIRGVESSGMLCSQRELGLGDDHSGLWVLPPGIAAGTAMSQLLELPDQVLELDLTPNRGDCQSLIGIAREVATLNELSFAIEAPAPVGAVHDTTFAVELAAGDACPVYVGRIIRGISSDARTPLWMCERLRRGGVRPLHPVVDVTNYVMLELGQPMHGFDLAQLSGGIVVRWAEQGEKLTLLDGREISLDEECLVIADHERALALGGVMGGESSAVSGDTTDVFLESAFFSPQVIAGKARSFGLHTDASHRFERGVDPAIQARAMERATALLVEIVGGEPGPLIEARREQPESAPAVTLRSARISRVLGIEIASERVETILRGLGMSVEATEHGWLVRPPSFRFDISIEEDLIEEIARIHGYDRIPEEAALAPVSLPSITETRLPVERAAQTLVDRGYHEVITYSFIDAEAQARFEPEIAPAVLANPLSEDLAHMRVSLWPGLVKVAKDNFSRQQDRVRIFESGVKFLTQDNDLKEVKVIAGLISGDVYPEQWGEPARAADFFDIKSDVSAIVRQTGRYGELEYQKSVHPALHPGRSARVIIAGEALGWVGQLHPVLVSQHGFDNALYVFELETEPGLAANVPASGPISRYPAVRRDIALVVDESLAVADIVTAARAEAGALARAVFVFDIYRGGAIDLGRKSVALGLILQETSRTLTDEDIDRIVSAVVSRLEREFNAKIRD